MTTPRSKVATHYLTKVLAVAALALVGLTIFSRVHWLYLNPWPMDYLGFYYLKELEFRAAQGIGYYEKISPFFSVFSPLYRTSGLSSAIFFNLIILFTYFVWTVAALVTATDSKRSSWSKLEICFCLLLLIWGSDVVFSAIYSYPRQGIALGFLACGVLLLYPQHRPYTKVIGLTCVGCAVAFHIFAAIFLVAIGVGYAATTRPT